MHGSDGFPSSFAVVAVAFVVESGGAGVVACGGAAVACVVIAGVIGCLSGRGNIKRNEQHTVQLTGFVAFPATCPMVLGQN